MQPSLAAAAANFSDVLSLMLIVFVSIVGLSAGLTVLEAIQSYRVQKTQATVETTPVASSCREVA